MPSKLGFGNSRTPMSKKVSYGSAMHYKNPIKKKTDHTVIPFTEAELASARKLEKAGREGYSGKSGGFTDEDYKNYQKVYGKGANPNIKPYGYSRRSVDEIAGDND